MFSEKGYKMTNLSTVQIMSIYLKKKYADQFGGIGKNRASSNQLFLLQASFHSNVYSNCWRIRISA